MAKECRRGLIARRDFFGKEKRVEDWHSAKWSQKAGVLTNSRK